MYDSLVMSSEPGTFAEQIAADLRKRIASGEFDAHGDKLPSDRTLVEHYRRSRMVIRAVIAQLTAEGLIYSRERYGHYVRRARPVIVSASGAVTIPPGGAASGTPRTVPQVHVIGGPDNPVPADVATRLGIAPGNLVVLRDRVCYLGDTPYMLLPSWYPWAVAAGTPLMHPVEQAAPGGHGLLSGIGIKATPGDDYLHVRMASTAEADRLELPGVGPVLEWTRTFRGAGRKPVAVQRAILPGDRAALAATIS